LGETADEVDVVVVSDGTVGVVFGGVDSDGAPPDEGGAVALDEAPDGAAAKDGASYEEAVDNEAVDDEAVDSADGAADRSVDSDGGAPDGIVDLDEDPYAG
jgi:hypothetical protein